MDDTQRPKRPRRDDDDGDDGGAASESAGPAVPSIIPPVSLVSRSLRSSSQSPTKKSKSSSPARRLANINLGAHGISVKSLALGSGPSLPEELRGLVKDIKAAERMQLRVIPEALRRDMASYPPDPRRDPLLEPFRDSPPNVFAAPDELNNIVPRLVGIADVLDIIEQTEMSGELLREEAGWNHFVHFPLLQLAVHGTRRPDEQLLQVDVCTSAGIISEYQRINLPSKKIDFAVAVFPEYGKSDEDKRMARHIGNLVQYLPDQSINQTSHPSLLRRPIALSVETKGIDGPITNSGVQITVWLEAQWNLLWRLVNLMAWQDDRAEGDPLASIAFLPALTVRGESWYLSAMAKGAAGELTMWQHMHIGNTDSVPGVYRIIWVIQRLCYWAEHTYWPALRSIISSIQCD